MDTEGPGNSGSMGVVYSMQEATFGGSFFFSPSDGTTPGRSGKSRATSRASVSVVKLADCRLEMAFWADHPFLALILIVIVYLAVRSLFKRLFSKKISDFPRKYPDDVRSVSRSQPFILNQLTNVLSTVTVIVNDPMYVCKWVILIKVIHLRQ